MRRCASSSPISFDETAAAYEIVGVRFVGAGKNLIVERQRAFLWTGERRLAVMNPFQHLACHHPAGTDCFLRRLRCVAWVETLVDRFAPDEAGER